MYYCYKILLNAVPNIPDLQEIDSYKLLSMNLKEMDKKTLNILLEKVTNMGFDKSKLIYTVQE